MQPDSIKTFASRYDRMVFDPLMRAYYGPRAYYNTGYWLESGGTQAEASHHLVRRLLDAVPTQVHSIVDVACGLGATTQDVAAKWPEATIVGINFFCSATRALPPPCAGPALRPDGCSADGV